MTIITDKEIVEQRSFYSHNLDWGVCTRCAARTHEASHVWCGDAESFLLMWGDRYGVPARYAR